MGRHSAPDGDDTRDDTGDHPVDAAVAVIDAPGAMGRHSYDVAVDGLELIEDVLEDEPPRGAPAASASAASAPPPPTAHPEAATTQFPAVVDPEAPEPQTTTDLIPVITEPIFDQPTAAPAEIPSAPSASEGPSVPRGVGHTASAADLTLVREHADVRARCLAALVAPFLIYVVVFFAIGLLDTRKALFLLFAPLIVAGVLVGLFLDLGHKRYPTAAVPAPPAPTS